MIIDLTKPVAFAHDADDGERIAAYAALLREEATDLDDETDAWRVLMRNGVTPGDAIQYSADAIRAARETMQGATL